MSHLDIAGPVDQAGSVDQIDQAGSAGQAGQAGRAGQAGQAGQVDQAGSAGQVGQTNQVDQVGAVESSAGTEGTSPSGTSMREWLAGALATACDDEISAEEILSADCPFVALGITSIAMVRLVDAIEIELDVFIEFGGDTWFLKDLDSLTSYLAKLADSCRRGRSDEFPRPSLPASEAGRSNELSHLTGPPCGSRSWWSPRDRATAVRRPGRSSGRRPPPRTAPRSRRSRRAG